MFIGTVPQSIQNFRNRRVTIDRPLYREEDIQQLDDGLNKPLLTKTVAKCKDKVKKYGCKDVLNSVKSFFPILSWLPKYKKGYVVKDLSAGITLGVMQIPQGMAYGMLTTLPAIYGLYTSLIPVLVYFFMGSSMHVSLGTFAVVSLMVGESVENHLEAFHPDQMERANGTSLQDLETEIRVQYAVTMSFFVGIIQTIFGILHFDFITLFLSDPLISGFTTGAAFHIFSSQVKHLVGLNIPRKETSGFFSLFKIYGYIFTKIKQVNYVSFIIGVVATILLFVIKYLAQKYKAKIKFPIPAELIVVALGTGLSYGFHFSENYNVKTLKKVPKGLPPISTPSFNMFSNMLVDCVTIAIVSFTISVSVAKAFAKKHKMKIDPNQELYAHGIGNIVSSFFSCFVSSASLSRSLVQESLCKTQLAGVLSSALILLVLTVLAPLFQPLPNAILAAVVLTALKGLFRQFSVVKILFKISKIDTFIWISSFSSVVLFGVDYGLAVGFVFNLLATVIRASRPSTTLMGNLDGTEIYTRINIDSAIEIPGVKIFRFHAPLFYANVEYFQETLFKATVSPNNYVRLPVPQCYQIKEKDKNDESKEKENGNEEIELDDLCKSVFVDVDDTQFCPTHTIILDCSQISYSDSMGVSTLITICVQYKTIGVDVLLSNCPVSMLKTLQAGGFTSLTDVNNIFVTTHCAVNHAYSKLHTEGVCDPDAAKGADKAPWELLTLKENDDDVLMREDETVPSSDTPNTISS